ncbi:MAG: hypothetical protein AB8F34_08720 [Akkermansiaceae bacterium]
MKKLATQLLAAALMVMSAHALEQRTFHNTDKSKSFDATLTGFDAQKKKVTVLNASGKKLSFSFSMLSEECQKYVLSKKDLLAIARYVRLDFEEVKGERSGDAIPTHFDIEVYNRGQRAIEDVEVKYTLYYRQGNLAKGGSDAKTSSGTLSTGKIYDTDSITLSTQKISIVRKSKPASGGG